MGACRKLSKGDGECWRRCRGDGCGRNPGKEYSWGTHMAGTWNQNVEALPDSPFPSPPVVTKQSPTPTPPAGGIPEPREEVEVRTGNSGSWAQVCSCTSLILERGSQEPRQVRDSWVHSHCLPVSSWLGRGWAMERRFPPRSLYRPFVSCSSGPCSLIFRVTPFTPFSKNHLSKRSTRDKHLTCFIHSFL